MPRAAELKRSRHAEAAGVPSRDQLLRVGAFAITKPGVEAIRSVLQRSALRRQAARAFLAGPLPLRRRVPFDLSHSVFSFMIPGARPSGRRGNVKRAASLL